MRYKAAVLCIIAALSCAAAYPQQKEIIGIAGDWNVLAKDASGTLQYGAWRISQQGTQLEVVSRWSHIEAIRQSSGTIAENGRIWIVGGPSDGWMESFNGMLSAGGAEITGTWSRVEGSSSSKGGFTASRARQQSAPAAPAAAAAQPAGGGKMMIEAPGSGAESRPATNPPVREEPVQTPPPTPTPVESAVLSAAAAAPARSQPAVAAEAVPDRQETPSDLTTLLNLLSALVEQNQMLARQLADVRNQSPDKDRLIDAQLAKQQQVFKLLERLIHSKVELEQLLDIFRRTQRNP